MPTSFWDNFAWSRPHTHHNLQDGLFQIASQTCNILVKVNNTNNICYNNNSSSGSSETSNVRYDFGDPREGSSTKVLIPHASKKSSSIFGYKHRLSTVLESTSFGNASVADDDLDQWEQSFMLRQENGGNSKKWGGDNWCRPSCIPISIILVLIVLVVLVPLLEHTNSFVSVHPKPINFYPCSDRCSVSLVESIPEGMNLSPNSNHIPTHKSWLDLINMADNTIEIASFYWTLRENEVYAHNSSKTGEEVFQALYNKGLSGKAKISIVQSISTKDNPNTDTETLAKKRAAEVRSINFTKFFGGGVLHTKLWLVDRTHFYVGSANMDWRSLTQVKELGVLGVNCSCLARDMGKIFDVYWYLGKNDSTIPETWPYSLSTKINKEHPFHMNLSGHNFMTYVSSSPAPLSPLGRTNDIDAILNTIRSAESFVYIAVMDYFPLLLYSPKRKYWSLIDDQIRSVAVENKVKVKMLISWWNHSRPAEDYFLRSLTALSQVYPDVDIQVKRFVVPSTTDQMKIPFARVNHNKYMVTDKVAYVGTSNWSGDYFVTTAGVGLVMESPDELTGATDNSSTDIRRQLQDVFERDWFSPYAVDLIK